ncbi:MAG: hypothetical protein JNJ57_03485, partial [Saprospiraceae bacterium]|nr:hypothetical protein [Saprospiraceae bacterium]
MSVFTIQAFQFSKQILFITACMLALNQLAGQNSCFSLKFSTEYAQQGDTVVIDVAVNGFTQIESYQFAIKWDPADLEYVKYSSVGAPISFQLFNPNAALTQGLFRTLWYDIDVAGVTLPDASVLFRLYLKVKTATPGFYPVACDPDNNPTQFSFFASGGGYKDLSHVVGGVLTGIPSSGLQIDTICANSPNCSGQNGSIQVGLQGGQAPFQYEWSGPNGFTSNQPSIFESGGGRYGLTVTDAAGNVAQAVAQLRPYTSSVNITFENTQKARCNLPNGCAVLTVTGNAPPYTVNWGDNGSTDLERCDLTPGTHWVTATNNQGCSTAMEVVIEKDSLMWVKIDSINADCRIDQPGGATVSTNGTGPFQYKWSTGATTPSIAGIYPGNYKVTVIDSNGCVGFDEAVVRDYGTFDWAISTYYLPNYSYFPEVPGSSANVTLTSSTIKDRAEFPLTISWSQGSASNLEKKQITSNHILDRQFNLPNGLYHVTVTDAEGCSEVRPVSVLLPKPSPELPEESEYNLPRFFIKDQNSDNNLDSCVEVY